MSWILFILGALFAGFIQGLTGFAFALIAMSFWVWGLSPQLAAPLVVFASIWCHLISMHQDKKSSIPTLSKRHLLIPYILAGCLGIPIGSYLLQVIEIQTFKLILGIFLILWSPLMLLNPRIQAIQHSGKYADACIGFIGGILGGLGGFCGSIPSAWLMLKQLSKQDQRYILRHFNFAIQVITLLVYFYTHTITSEHLPYMFALMILVSVPAILGARLFYKISEQHFKRLVLSLLFASGLVLVWTSF